MRVFKSRAFHRFAQKARLEGSTLLAAREVRAGRFDADLGGGVFKKRIARAGGGKSGGYRTLLICSHADLTVFQYGFAKGDRDDISVGELEALRKLARDYRALTLEMAREVPLKIQEDEDQS